MALLLSMAKAEELASCRLLSTGLGEGGNGPFRQLFARLSSHDHVDPAGGAMYATTLWRYDAPKEADVRLECDSDTGLFGVMEHRLTDLAGQYDGLVLGLRTDVATGATSAFLRQGPAGPRVADQAEAARCLWAMLDGDWEAAYETCPFSVVANRVSLYGDRNDDW